MVAIVIVVAVFVLTFLLFYGFYHFSALVEKDKKQLFNFSGNTEQVVRPEDLAHLPEIMRDYLQKVGVIGKCRDCHLILKQHGKIRQKKNGKWRGFTARQCMTSVPIGFVWAARAFPVFVKDMSIKGVAEVSISIMGLWTASRKKSAKINTSALNRCLAELVLYPVAFVNPAIRWEALDNTSVKAKISLDGTATEGVFYFDESGLIERFESLRYKGDVLEKFTGKMENYSTMADFYIPTRMRAIWNLKEVDFEYFNCDIVDYRID